MVDRLHVHRFPDGPSFCMEKREGFQNLCRAALPLLRPVEGFSLTPDLSAKGIPVNQQAAQPIIRYALFLIKGIHRQRQISQVVSVPLIDRLFLCNMLVQIWQLPPDHTGNHIADAVIIADLLVFIPGRILSGLGGPLPHLVRTSLIIGKQHPSGTAGNDLVSIKTDGTDIPEIADLSAPIGCTEGLCRIFHQQRPMRMADLHEFLDLPRHAIEMRIDDQLHIRIHLKRLRKRLRRHIPGFRLRIDKDRFPALVGYRIDAGVKGHIRAKNFFPF